MHEMHTAIPNSPPSSLRYESCDCFSPGRTSDPSIHSVWSGAVIIHAAFTLFLHRIERPITNCQYSALFDGLYKRDRGGKKRL